MESPLAKGVKVIQESQVPTQTIIDLYKKRYQMDVAHFFEEAYIQIYRCPESGYRFYYPYRPGDSKFYEALQAFDWYYMPWKWEYDMCMQRIDKEQYVLEIGCGEGDFIQKVYEQKQAHCIGLELNEAIKAPSPEVKILHDSIEDYSQQNPESFDVVCSFQVLEHIVDIRSYLESSIQALKKGGLLVICVPNNGSFLQYDDENILNMPPHHMGLWNEESLKNLVNYFSIDLEGIHLEPLQKYHFNYYLMVQARRKAGRLFSGAFGVLLSLGLHNLTDSYLTKRAQHIPGHSILAVYRKV